MNPDERDSDDFFEALAGRRERGSGPAALRDALAAQARTLREADAAGPEALNDEDRARLAALKERLRAAGAFHRGDAPAMGAALRPATPAQRLRDWLRGAAWQRPLAIAAGVVLASVLGLQLATLDDDDPSRVMRGAATPAITAPDPAARAADLERALSAAGAQVVREQVNAGEWSLVVQVPDPARAAAVQQLLREAGFAIAGPPPYELAVRAAR